MVSQISFSTQSANPFVEAQICHITEDRRIFFGEWLAPSGKLEDIIINPAPGESYVMDCLANYSKVHVRQPRVNTYPRARTPWRGNMRPLGDQPIWVQEAVKSKNIPAPKAPNLFDLLDPDHTNHEAVKTQKTVKTEKTISVEKPAVAIHELARRLGISRQTAYRRVVSLKIEVTKGAKGHGYVTAEQASEIEKLQAHIDSKRNQKASVDPYTPAPTDATQAIETKPKKQDKIQVEIHNRLDAMYLQSVIFNIRNRSKKDLPVELQNVKTCADVVHVALEHCRKSGFWMTKTQMMEGLTYDA